MSESKEEKKVVKKEGAPKGARSRKDASGGVSYKVEAGKPKAPAKTPRLKTNYHEKVVPELLKQLGLKNPMEVPALDKIVISMCLKDALVNPKALDIAAEEIALISGQKPRINRAKKSIAAFKLRGGQAIGASVTLRRARMYEFFDRLVNIALPRVRDFKGVNTKSFDGRGNYSMGLKEQIIFPEINYDRIDKIRGMNITIATTAKNNEHARALLAEMGMPFRK
jgi:large subunit ribosomal protein L5